MDLQLIRTEFRSDGIFGEFEDNSGNIVCVTLEHAYDDGTGIFKPKIPSGTYTCKRSQHQLEGMAQPFITFQIMDVPGHTNCLIHFGNWENDSDGCILIGAAIAQSPKGQMITSSKDTFQKFMDMQSGIDAFQLMIIDPSILT